MFVVPAHRRVEVSRATFAALEWTIAALADLDVAAGAVVIADDRNVDVAAAHGFDTVRLGNPLGQKLNAGYAHAAAADAEFAVYLGSDDLISPALVARWVRKHRSLGVARAWTIVATRSSAVVSPDGRRIASLRIPYEGGDGVRLVPTRLLQRVGHAPIPPQRRRVIDGGLRDALRASGRLAWKYVDSDPLEITDLKTQAVQLTSYESCVDAYAVNVSGDPWGDLSAVYPERIVCQAAGVYGLARAAA